MQTTFSIAIFRVDAIYCTKLQLSPCLPPYLSTRVLTLKANNKIANLLVLLATIDKYFILRREKNDKCNYVLMIKNILQPKRVLYELMIDHRSYTQNLSSCEIKA